MNTYIVWCAWLGQKQRDGLKIKAVSARCAAEEYGAVIDSRAEADLIAGSKRGVEVRVLECVSGRRSDWMVRGELTPSYIARQLESSEYEFGNA